MRDRSLRRRFSVAMIVALVLTSLGLSAASLSPQGDVALAADLPDLTLTFGAVGGTDNICAGSSPVFQGTVTNNGTAAAGSFVVRVTVDNFASQQETVPGLGVGQSQNTSRTWDNISLGTHTITATVDANNQVTESNENNNSQTLTFTVKDCSPPPPPPACSNTSGSWGVTPTTVQAGGVVTISGNGAPGGWYEGLVVRFNLTPANGFPVPLGQATVTCQSGQPFLQLAATIPSNTSAGTAQITATDAKGTNSGPVALQVTAATSTPTIDLQVSSVAASSGDAFCDGSTRQFNATIRNNGNTASGAFTLRWALSGGGTADESVPSLAPGAETTRSRSFQLSGTGSKTVSATADVNGVVAETNEDNNAGQTTFNVVSCAGPPPSGNITLYVPFYCFLLDLNSTALVNTECGAATLNGQAGVKSGKHTFEFANVQLNGPQQLRLYPDAGNQGLYCEYAAEGGSLGGSIQSLYGVPACTYTNTGVIVRSVNDAPQVFKPWQRTDSIIPHAVVRTWMWGPNFFFAPIAESYVEAGEPADFAGDTHGPYRFVVYFDKSRMEITEPGSDPNAEWYITNGLLASELISGKLQLGNGAFEQRAPAQVNVAGDPDDLNGPTYATFSGLQGQPKLANGATITQTVDRAGNVGNDGGLGQYGATAVDVGVPTNHTIASVFWDFMNSSGTVSQGGQNVQARISDNPYYITGFPLTEPFWARVKVGGTVKWVLVQVFERRVMTYTPDNPDGWKVEAGNVGQHYVAWRYGLAP